MHKSYVGTLQTLFNILMVTPNVIRLIDLKLAEMPCYNSMPPIMAIKCLLSPYIASIVIFK